jgi:cation diffusion facilitator CzcD-associated flavoprotein CzcO
MAEKNDYDAVIVGAGFSGIYLLKSLRDLGMTAVVLDAAGDVGGTWWWNTYPGARSDSDSTVYCFSDRFSRELLDQWEWKERYPSQPEIHSYLRWVTDELDLWDGIRLNTRVDSATWDDASSRWDVRTAGGETLTGRYFIPAVGALSKPMVPDFPGMDRFKGELHHTARLPEGTSFAGKKVAVVGNGATAVQIVPEVAKEAAEVWEFVRHPYHCIPGGNHPMDAAQWKQIHETHDQIWDTARHNFLGFPYPDFKGEAKDFSPEERRRIMDELWSRGGFQFGLSAFSDVFVNKDTNDEYLEYFAEKIQGRVKDPETAKLVTPTEPFASKRPPLEHGYYDALNRDNVHVVPIKDTPISEITENGVKVGDTEYPVDVILLATGFDAFTGAITAMDIRGRDGRSLAEEWRHGPEDYLGLMIHGYPNLFMAYCGPFNPAILINAPTLIEQQGEWILKLLTHLRNEGLDYVEPTKEAQDEFMALCDTVANATLIPQTNSWWTGTNVDGKTKRLLSWAGGFPEYHRLCDEAAEGWAPFTMKAAAPA